jgi:hypothetical protein
MFDFTTGTVILILIGIIIAVIHDLAVKKATGSETIIRIRLLVLLALGIRIVWYILYFGYISGHYPFAITDDYNYHIVAMHNFSSLREGRNNYGTFLVYLYHFFGASSLNGRILNFVVSVIAVYPLAYLESTFPALNKKFLATKLYCCVPYMVIIASFEIKDVMTLLFYISGCAVIRRMLLGEKWGLVPLLVLFGALTELMRIGMGILLGVTFICGLLVENRKVERKKKATLIVLSIGAIFLLAYFLVSKLLPGYYEQVLGMLEQYIRGRNRIIDNGSLFNFLTIKSWKEIWKVPLDLLFFVLLPYSGEHTGRFVLDFGAYLRLADVPICLAGLCWLLRNISKFGVLTICILVPYVYLACFQIVAYRELIFIMPLIYLCSANWFYSNRSSRVLVAERKTIYMSQFLLSGSYVVWTFVVIALNIII